MRQFKAKPWIFRRIIDAGTPQKPKKIEITLEVERASYGKDDERLLVFALAQFLGIDVEHVRITSIEDGSTKVIVELPGDESDRLVSAFEVSPEILQGKLSPYHIASILPKEEDLRTMLERERSLTIKERSPDEYSSLRNLLMHSPSAEYKCFLAFRLAELYAEAGNYNKGLFYNRIAEDNANQAGLSRALGSIYLRRGNILLLDSHIEAALDSFKKALEKLPGVIDRPVLHTNIGYCNILLNQHSEGFSYLFSALRTLIHLRVRGGIYLLNVHQDLAFAHMETGRYRHAKRHAERALQIAKASDESTGEKNALYLLGGVSNLLGDSEEARRYFQTLQIKFFPEAGYLPDFLLATDLKFRRGIALGDHDKSSPA